MSYRSFALAVAAFSSIYAASADAQSVYVAPGGVYIGAGPVYVIPAPNAPVPYAAPPAVAPSYYGSYYGYEYGPPAVAAPAPVVVAPGAGYGPEGGYHDPPLSAYGAAPRLRPPAPIPSANSRCATRGYDQQRRPVCY